MNYPDVAHETPRLAELMNACLCARLAKVLPLRREERAK